jgi:hypothetical protein
MSEQTPDQTPTPPAGVEPVSPPDTGQPAPEPIGQTPEAVAGEPPSDADQGVGVAPTQPGDAGEGNPGTAFQTTEQVEGSTADTPAEGETPA